MFLVSPSNKYHSILLSDKPVSLYRPFWDKCTEWLQSHIKNATTGLKIPHLISLVPQSPKCQSVSLFNHLIWVNWPILDTCTSDPKRTLNATKSKVPHYSLLSKSPTMVRDFWIISNLRQVDQMIPKWPKMLQGQRHALYVLYISVPKSKPVHFAPYIWMYFSWWLFFDKLFVSQSPKC